MVTAPIYSTILSHLSSPTHLLSLLIVTHIYSLGFNLCLRMLSCVMESERERVCVGEHGNLSQATSLQLSFSSIWSQPGRVNLSLLLTIRWTTFVHVSRLEFFLICPYTGKPASTFSDPSPIIKIVWSLSGIKPVCVTHMDALAPRFFTLTSSSPFISCFSSLPSYPTAPFNPTYFISPHSTPCFFYYNLEKPNCFCN